MNGDRNAPLLCKREDRTIIVGVECQPGIVRVKFDAVQRMIVNGAAERVNRFGPRIPDVDIRKGIKSAGIPPLHLGQISVHRVRQDVDVRVKLFQRPPVYSSRSDPSIQMCRCQPSRDRYSSRMPAAQKTISGHGRFL